VPRDLGKFRTQITSDAVLNHAVPLRGHEEHSKHLRDKERAGPLPPSSAGELELEREGAGSSAGFQLQRSSSGKMKH